MTDFHSIPGWFGDYEARFYGSQVERAEDPAHFVEIGAWQGRSACAMAEAIRRSGKLIRFDSVDTFQGSQYGAHPELVAALEAEGKTLRGEFERNLRDRDLWPYVNPIEGDSPTVAQGYANESLDFVFIDGDHRADAVEADCRAWWPKLKPGGILAGHDAQNPMVREGLLRSSIPEPAVRNAVWSVRKSERWARPCALAIPSRSPNCEPWRAYLKLGAERAGIEIEERDDLTGASYYQAPPRLPDAPYHVAALEVNGRRVWFDFSDFTEAWPHLGEPYFKVQCVNGCRPAGQHAYLDHPGGLLDALPALRDRAYYVPKTTIGTAHFSNIDELHNPPLRRRLIDRLRQRPDGHRWELGLWRYSDFRPAVGPPIERRKLPYLLHLDRLAASKIVLALPGVGGDFTRTHFEAMAIGSCLLTLKTDQLWPGNWRGCWPEMERDLSDLDAHIDRLLPDEPERERYARLSRWYWETNLRPDRYVRRLCDV